jgi:hypothetical protein
MTGDFCIFVLLYIYAIVKNFCHQDTKTQRHKGSQIITEERSSKAFSVTKGLIFFVSPGPKGSEEPTKRSEELDEVKINEGVI